MRAWLNPRQDSGQVTCLGHRNPLVDPGFDLRCSVYTQGEDMGTVTGQVESSCMHPTLRPEQGLRERYRCP